jgi:ferredoxin
MDDANQPQQSNQPAQQNQSIATDKEVIIGKYKVKVIRDGCIGAASCVAIAAETFQLDNENKAVIQEGSADTPDSILMAAQSCPTKAIIVTDTETGEQVWPA